MGLQRVGHDCATEQQTENKQKEENNKEQKSIENSQTMGGNNPKYAL